MKTKKFYIDALSLKKEIQEKLFDQYKGMTFEDETAKREEFFQNQRSALSDLFKNKERIQQSH